MVLSCLVLLFYLKYQYLDNFIAVLFDKVKHMKDLLSELGVY